MCDVQRFVLSGIRRSAYGSVLKSTFSLRAVQLILLFGEFLFSELRYDFLILPVNQ